MADSPAHGKGTFILEAVTAAEVLIIWGGELFADSTRSEARPGSAIAVEEGLYLAARRDQERTVSDYTNHSCDPTLWLLDEVTLAARRDLHAGEELTVDYATFEADEEWVMFQGHPCRCESPLCRAHVSGRDWRLPELQERYAGHFSPLLQSRIKAPG